MLRKFLFLILALAAITVAFVSYQKYYAREDVSRMVNDARLTASVKTALALNRHMKDTKVDVSVSSGVVTLSGAVGTEIQKQLAGEIARSIKGADNVRNEVVITKILTMKPAVQERTLGEKLDDLTIEAAIKTAFILNENVSARDIGVDSDRGLVTLTGSVVTPAEAELAAAIAEDIEGVLSVKIQLEVEGIVADADGRTLIEKVDDARVVTQVRAALTVNRNIDSSEIEVASQEGIVTLTGIVHGGAEKDLAHKIAEDCWGVKGVVNELRIIR